MKVFQYFRTICLASSLVLAGQACSGTLSCASERSPLDSFNAIQESLEADSGQDEIPAGITLLDDMMAGRYYVLPSDTEVLKEMAERLPVFCGITNADLACYASERDLYMAQVRNAYYKSLAVVLQAKIEMEPAVEEKYDNIRTILSLFLKMEEDQESDALRDEIRGQMTLARTSRIAEAFQLPEEFVGFVIMDRSWTDNNWRNDYAWHKESGWFADEDRACGELGIGSRDAPGETEISRMQEKLNALGYLSGKPDGYFGPRTQAALLEFQLANGMEPTGVYTVYEAMRLDSRDSVSRRDYDDEFWDPDEAFDDDDDDHDDDDHDNDDHDDDDHDNDDHDDDDHDDDEERYDDGDHDDDEERYDDGDHDDDEDRYDDDYDDDNDDDD